MRGHFAKQSHGDLLAKTAKGQCFDGNIKTSSIVAKHDLYKCLYHIICPDMTSFPCSQVFPLIVILGNLTMLEAQGKNPLFAVHWVSSREYDIDKAIIEYFSVIQLV